MAASSWLPASSGSRPTSERGGEPHSVARLPRPTGLITSSRAGRGVREPLAPLPAASCGFGGQPRPTRSPQSAQRPAEARPGVQPGPRRVRSAWEASRRPGRAAGVWRRRRNVRAGRLPRPLTAPHAHADHQESRGPRFPRRFRAGSAQGPRFNRRQPSRLTALMLRSALRGRGPGRHAGAPERDGTRPSSPAAPSLSASSSPGGAGSYLPAAAEVLLSRFYSYLQSYEE